MCAALFAGIAVTFAARFVQEEAKKNKKKRAFLMTVYVPVCVKRHHAKQSQNYSANLLIWLLGNRGKLWEGRLRKSDSDSDGDRESEF